MARDTSLDQKMNQIAHFVADKILSGQGIDSELNAAFKVLAGYWTSASKLDKVADDDEVAKSGFGGIKSRLKAVE